MKKTDHIQGIKGKNSQDVLQMNRFAVLQLISKNYGCSRADLAKATGLKQASISKIIAGLIEIGIVKEVGLVKGEKGRRSIGLGLNSSTNKVLGVKLSRTAFSVGLYDISGNEYENYTDSLDITRGARTAITKMKEVVGQFISKNPEIISIGIAIPGPFLKDDGKIKLITEFPGWEEVSLKEEFEEEFQIPIYVEHDANAGALAEWWFGDCKMESEVMVYFLASEGVGAGIISGGNLFVGNQGVAGEVGHMSIDYKGNKCSCGSYGCLETYCSTLSLVRETKKHLPEYTNSLLNDREEIKAEDIFGAMDQGDELSIKMVEQVAEYIGFGLINIVYIYNPQVIIIGDIITLGGDILLNKIKETLRRRLLPSLYENLIIKFSKLDKDPILYGAAAVAIDESLRNPEIYQQ